MWARLGVNSRPGALVGLLFYWGSLTPSLLPRPWYLQGLIAAICAILGYAIGVVLGWVGGGVQRHLELQIVMRPRAERLLTAAWWVLLVAGLVAMPWASLRSQQATSRYAEVVPPGPEWVALSTLVALGLAWVFLLIWRAIAALFDWLTLRLERRRFLRASISRVLASLLTIAIVSLFMDQVVLRGGLAIAERTAERVNAQDPAGMSAPTSPVKSGGPGSTQPWHSLGQDGAIFVSAGPSASDISEATGRAALDPIRVFAGVDRNPTMERSRDAVLAEMDRTDAWSRRSILIASATSTGFINEWGAAAFEYLQDGDTAIASMQYSTLPSALGLLTAPDDPPQAARLLWEGVAERVRALPEGSRPRVYVTGESLGAYGGNDAFESPEQMLAQVDGALWTGTPSFTGRLGELTDRRNPGSDEVNPVVANGRSFRFADNPRELYADRWARPLGEWEFPRVVYLQHRSDPVAWWSPTLIWQTPDWLAETRGEDPQAQMGWLPLVTFWQVTADMAMSNNVPGGHGHRYFAAETVPAWAAILGVDSEPEHVERFGAVIASITKRSG